MRFEQVKRHTRGLLMRVCVGGGYNVYRNFNVTREAACVLRSGNISFVGVIVLGARISSVFVVGDGCTLYICFFFFMWEFIEAQVMVWEYNYFYELFDSMNFTCWTFGANTCSYNPDGHSPLNR